MVARQGGSRDSGPCYLGSLDNRLYWSRCSRDAQFVRCTITVTRDPVGSSGRCRRSAARRIAVPTPFAEPTPFVHCEPITGGACGRAIRREVVRLLRRFRFVTMWLSFRSLQYQGAVHLL